MKKCNGLIKLAPVQESGTLTPYAISFNCVEQWFCQGQELRRLGRYPEALVMLHQVMRCQPDWVEVWVELGRVWSLLECPVQALRMINKALQLDPSHPQVQDHREQTIAKLAAMKAVAEAAISDEFQLQEEEDVILPCA